MPETVRLTRQDAKAICGTWSYLCRPSRCTGIADKRFAAASAALIANQASACRAIQDEIMSRLTRCT